MADGAGERIGRVVECVSYFYLVILGWIVVHRITTSALDLSRSRYADNNNIIGNISSRSSAFFAAACSLQILTLLGARPGAQFKRGLGDPPA